MDAKHMTAKDARNLTINTIKEYIKTAAAEGRSYVQVKRHTISDEVMKQMQQEGFTFELRGEILMDTKRGGGTVYHVYRISW